MGFITGLTDLNGIAPRSQSHAGLIGGFHPNQANFGVRRVGTHGQPIAFRLRLFSQRHRRRYIAVGEGHGEALGFIAGLTDLNAIAPRSQGQTRLIGGFQVEQLHRGLGRIGLHRQTILGRFRLFLQGHRHGQGAIDNPYWKGARRITRLGHFDLIVAGGQLHAGLIGQRRIEQANLRIRRLGAHGQTILGLVQGHSNRKVTVNDFQRRLARRVTGLADFNLIVAGRQAHPRLIRRGAVQQANAGAGRFGAHRQSVGFGGFGRSSDHRRQLADLLLDGVDVLALNLAAAQQQGGFGVDQARRDRNQIARFANRADHHRIQAIALT